MVAKIQQIRSCFFLGGGERSKRLDPKWWMDWRIEFPSYSWDGIYVPTDDPTAPANFSIRNLQQARPQATWIIATTHLAHRSASSWWLGNIPIAGSSPILPPKKTNMTMEDPPIWRCISYWTWEFFNVMLVFRGEKNLEFPIHCPTPQANISGNWTFSSQKHLAHMEDRR